MPVVTLSNEQPCKVRQLGLFELDGKGREILGPYKYQLLLATGQIVEDSYDIHALTYTPTKPGTPIDQIQPNSPEWFQLQDYETYQAALIYEKARVESYEGYANDIVAYILANCIDEPDGIITAEDWQIVYQAALVPQLTEEGLASCLAETFPGLVWQ